MTTVSRVLNESGYTSEETRKRVQAAVLALSYKPNLVARGLVSGKTQTVGLLIPDVTNPFFADIAKGVEEAAIDAGFTTILCNFDWDMSRERTYIDLLKGKSVDGIIIVGSRSEEHLLISALHPTPYVFADRKLKDYEHFIWMDHFKGGVKATEHLLDIGCKNIVHIAGPENSLSALQRKNGFLSVYPKGQVFQGDFRYQSGFEIARRILEQKNRPDGIFAGNDLMAIGVIQAALSLGISIPEELAVVGYDDIEMAWCLNPALTTIRQPAYEIGKAAFQKLHHQELGLHEFKPVLIQRDSTKRRIT